MAQCLRYYVNPFNSNKLNDTGLSWDDSFITLERALLAVVELSNDATNQIFLIGNHTYYPNTTQRDNCFNIPNRVTIFGGFKGTEKTSGARPLINTDDYETYKTIISGDIGIKSDNSDNCYHVITYNKKLTLDRVVISDGNANYEEYNGYSNQNNSLHRYGAGIITSDSTQKTELTLLEVTFLNNIAMNGGALWFSSNPNTPVDVEITHCIFENNKAISSQYEGGYGGAIYLYFLASIDVKFTEFIDNYAANRGGAIYQDYGGILSVFECIFDSNVADGFGGAIFGEDRNSQTNGTFPVISSSSFYNNTAKLDGGAITWLNNVEGTLEYNTFDSNIAGRYGGAVALIDSVYNEGTDYSDYSHNTAISDVESNNIYIESEFLYNSMDNGVDVVVTAKMSELQIVYNNIEPVANVYPSTDDTVCHVDIDNVAQSTPTGTSWQNAFVKLQDCLDALELIGGGEIWVKSGLYTPSKVPEWKTLAGKGGPAEKSFVMYDNIKIYGGFDGKERHRNHRDFATNPTFLSCNLGILQNDVDVTYCNQILMAADNTVIDGFIFIEAGYGGLNVNRRRRLKNSISVQEVLSSTGTKSGSGIYSNSSTITVVNSIFYKLYAATKGGAVYCIGQEGENVNNIKSPKFINVAFIGNRAEVRGGAISADVSCNFECNYCIFDDNSCAKKGGAIYLDFDSDIIVKNSIFNRNIAMESGGCIAADGKSKAIISNTKLNDNAAKWEGGCLYSGSGVSRKLEQGFEINAYAFPVNDVFNGNYLYNYNDVNGQYIGAKDVYLWPFSFLKFSKDSTSPTPEPTNQPTVPPTRETPNFLIFIIDDIEYTSNWNETLSAPATQLNGETVEYLDIATPNIDEFMSESIVFQRSYSNPKCSPSRYSLLTGRQVTRSSYGVDKARKTTDGSVGMSVTVPFSRIWGDDETYNIPNVLSTNSNYKYYTGSIGKWHLMSGDDNGNNIGCDSLSYQPNSALYLECKSIVKKQGFDYVDGYYHSNIDSNNYFSHNPEWMMQKTHEFIDLSIAADAPFFLYFSMTLNHDPSILDALVNYTSADTPKGVLTTKNTPNARKLNMNDRLDIYQETLTMANNAGINITDIDKINKMAATIWTDNTFGALIEHLKFKKLYDNTFIILLNDHGMGSKGLLYEHGTRILQNIRYPPLFNKNGYILSNDFIVDTTDLASVIFELAKVDLNNDFPEYIVDSKNWLKDVIKEINTTDNGQIIDYDTNPPNCCNSKIIDVYNSHTIIKKNYKYIFRATSDIEAGSAKNYYPYSSDMEELYDLTIDGNEQINLINNSNTSGIIKDILFEFRLSMREYIEDVVCLSYDITDCIIPDIPESSIPDWSSWSAPTLSPTPPGYTCDSIIEFDFRWKGVLSFKERIVGDQYRTEAQNEWLNIQPITYQNQSLCGSNTFDAIEYLYNFTKINRILDIEMMICCNGSFGNGWFIPEGFAGNEVFELNMDANNIFDGNDNNNENTVGIKAVIAINAVIIICFIFIVGLCFYQKQRKYKIEINKLNNYLQTEKTESKYNNNNTMQPTVIKSVRNTRGRSVDSLHSSSHEQNEHIDDDKKGKLYSAPPESGHSSNVSSRRNSLSVSINDSDTNNSDNNDNNKNNNNNKPNNKFAKDVDVRSPIEEEAFETDIADYTNVNKK